MIFYTDYLVYIIYSFFTLFILYICLLIYKRYSFIIFCKNNIITSEKISSNNYKSKKNTTSYKKKIKKIKNEFKIKSTEKTYNDIMFVSNKPKYINLCEKENLNIMNNLTISDDGLNKKFNNSEMSQKSQKLQNIAKVYLCIKQKYYDTFINPQNNSYYINNLIEFDQFHKSNFDINSNILIKFYDNDINNNYMFVFVNGNKIIKITQIEEYDKITSMIEQNDGIFLLENEETKNEYYICYGSYIQSKTNQEEIKKIFFINVFKPEKDKNYLLLSEYKLIKIYFFISGKIC